MAAAFCDPDGLGSEMEVEKKMDAEEIPTPIPDVEEVPASPAPKPVDCGNAEPSQSHKVDQMVIRNAVIKIFCTRKRPMWYYPFQNDYQRNSTSSGFIINASGTRYIMCNGHGIAHATSIRVRKNGDDTKYLATVAHVTHEGDLALLVVKKKKFWKDTTPLNFHNILPELQAEVIVMGYPTGGDSLSITKGVVSRIGVQKYTHSKASLPTIQTDAAINSGNSGGPAIMNNQVIGVAFQGKRSSQNIGYVIPYCVVHCFLSSVLEHGKFCGFGQIGIAVQTLENESFRDFLKIGERTGVRVKKTNPLADSSKKLKPDDVMLEIDGKRIGNDATVELRQSERVSWWWVFSMKRPGSMAKIKIFREGKEDMVEVELYPERKNDGLVPRHLHDEKPTYFVHGGLVLTRLSWPLLSSTYGSSWWQSMPPVLKHKAYKPYRDKENEQVVVMTQILDNPVNINYKVCQTLERVQKINGVDVLNVEHALKLILSTEGKFLRIDFEHMGSIVLNQKLAFEANPKIKEEHRMFSLWSDNLKDVLLLKCKEDGTDKFSASPVAATRTDSTDIDIQNPLTPLSNGFLQRPQAGPVVELDESKNES